MSLKNKIFSRMEELGINPKRSLGQNFLVSDQVVAKIITAAEPAQFSKTIEIGPGLGALTDELHEQAQSLQLVELDKTFANYWRQKDFVVDEIDALKWGWGQEDVAGCLLVSNLPYHISSRLVVDLSLLNQRPQRMVLMFQKEVAQRVVANHTSSDYGLLSVIAQSFWDVDFILEAGAVDFYPSPKVASRVLKFEAKAPAVSDPKAFLKFLKVCFQQRRKKLAPKLTTWVGKAQLAEIFESLSITPTARVDQLSCWQLQQLYSAVKKE